MNFGTFMDLAANTSAPNLVAGGKSSKKQLTVTAAFSISRMEACHYFGKLCINNVLSDSMETGYSLVAIEAIKFAMNT